MVLLYTLLVLRPAATIASWITCVEHAGIVLVQHQRRVVLFAQSDSGIAVAHRGTRTVIRGRVHCHSLVRASLVSASGLSKGRNG